MFLFSLVRCFPLLALHYFLEEVEVEGAVQRLFAAGRRCRRMSSYGTSVPLATCSLGMPRFGIVTKKRNVMR